MTLPTAKIGDTEVVLSADAIDPRPEEKNKEINERRLRLATFKLIAWKRISTLEVWMWPVVLVLISVVTFLYSAGLFGKTSSALPGFLLALAALACVLAVVFASYKKVMAMTLAVAMAYSNKAPEDIFQIVGVEQVRGGKLKVTLQDVESNVYVALVDDLSDPKFPHDDPDNLNKLANYVAGRLQEKWRSIVEAMNKQGFK